MQNHLHSNGIIGNEAGMVGSEACPNQCLAISMHRAPTLLLIYPLKHRSTADGKEGGEEKKRHSRRAGEVWIPRPLTQLTSSEEKNSLCLKTITHIKTSL